MGPLLALVLLAGPTALKGSEAAQQLRDFEHQTVTQDAAGGKRPDVRAERLAFKKKADELLTGVDLTAVPAAEALDWTYVLNTATRYTDAITLLDRVLATHPDPALAVPAMIAEANDYRLTRQLDKATALLQDVKPTNDGQANSLALADAAQAAALSRASGEDAGMKFLDAVSAAFASYPKASARLTMERKVLLEPSTRAKLIGQPAPALPILPEKYGDFTSLEALKGKVVVLDFFAHWCPPCKASFPDMRAMSDALGDKVAVIGVTGYYGYYGTKHGITKQEEFADMKDFMAEYKIDHPVVYEDRGSFADYGVSGIPEFVLIGKDGTVKKIQLGYDKPSFADFRAAVEAEAK